MICWLLGHTWKDVGVNRWQITIEQECRLCGEHRHHLFEDLIGDKISWRPGRHPKYNMNTEDPMKQKYPPDDITVFHNSGCPEEDDTGLKGFVQYRPGSKDYAEGLIQVWYCPTCGAFDKGEYDGEL